MERIITAGTMYLDINSMAFSFGDGMQPNQEYVGGNYEVVPGGSALNFARFCAALELAPVFIGKAGSDPVGKILADLIRDTGVNPAFVTDKGVQTNISMNYHSPEGSSIMNVVGSANQNLRGDEVLAQMRNHIDGTKFVYLGGCFKLKSLMSAYESIANLAREKGAKIVLDHGRITNATTDEDKKLMRVLVAKVDYYLPSRDEFLALWEVENIESGLTKVRQESNALTIIKDAKNGAIGYDATSRIHVPAFDVEVTNSIGAGDCFNAGFIKARSMGLDLLSSMRYGCAAAAIKISQNYLPTPENVEQMISSIVNR